MKNDTQTQDGGAVAYKDLLADMEIVHRQLHCVKHLCEVVAALADAHIRMLPATAINPEYGHHLIKMQGDQAYHFMEWVGDYLNAMDAVTKEDNERWSKTFGDAQARWKNFLNELNAKSANAGDERRSTGD